MISDYTQLNYQLKEISPSVVGGQMQKVFSSTRFICLHVRVPGKTHYLYLGRGGGFEGLWLGDKNLPSKLRVVDRLVEIIRSHLLPAKVLSLENRYRDRVVALKLSGDREFYYFYNGRKSYFILVNLKNRNSVFCSWKKGFAELPDNVTIEDLFREVGLKEFEFDPHAAPLVSSIESQLEEELAYVEKNCKKIETKNSNKINRKIKNIESDIKRLLAKNKIIEFMNQNDLSTLPWKTKVEGIKFHFKKESHYARRSEIFDKIKKYDELVQMMEKRRDEALKQLKPKEIVLDNSIVNIISPFHYSERKEAPKKEIERAFRIIKEGNLEIAYGLSPQGNNQLLSTYAGKNDWWIHLSQDSSSHVIIRESLGSPVDMKFWPLLSQVYKSKDFEIVFTKARFVKTMKGKAGLVTYSKDKRLRIKL